jgi:predicted DNA-binding transcriptional regulator YafY
MSWGRHAEILEPEFLRVEVLQELSEGMKAYMRRSRKAEPV